MKKVISPQAVALKSHTFWLKITIETYKKKRINFSLQILLDVKIKSRLTKIFIYINKSEQFCKQNIDLNYTSGLLEHKHLASLPIVRLYY